MSDPSEVAELSPAEVAGEHREGRVILLDVRERDEWDAGHAPGAVHVPLSLLDPSQVAAARGVVAVCRSGNRSGTAARMLAAAGVQVVNMAGGMTEWARAGLPVVTDAGQPGTVR
jgi:rhodanese-related sulfurtransferase